MRVTRTTGGDFDLCFLQAREVQLEACALCLQKRGKWTWCRHGSEVGTAGLARLFLRVFLRDLWLIRCPQSLALTLALVVRSW
jgi:hypothetical protein